MLTASRLGADRRQDVRCLVPRLPENTTVVLVEPALVSTPQGSYRLDRGAHYHTSAHDAADLVARRIARWLTPREVRS